jgi:dnd system-associated protein 4
MSKGLTIWEAASTALNALGGSGTLNEIYRHIVDNGLYEFGTEDPNDAPHILDTELKRKSRNSGRTDRSGDHFELTADGTYSVKTNSPSTMTEKKSAGTKRIYRARDKEDIINALMSEKVGVFREIWRLLLFAAQVGIKNGKRHPLVSIDSGKGIDQTTFGNCPSWPGVCHLISLVEEHSSDVLSGGNEAEDLRITIFQEYANGGLEMLKEHFSDRNIDLDTLVGFIEDHSKSIDLKADLDLSI